MDGIGQETIWTGIGGLLLSFFTWLAGGRQRNAKAAGMEIGNVKEALAIWQKTAESLEAKLKEQEHQINNLRNQIGGLYSRMNELTHENTRLRNALHEAGIQYDSLYDE